MKPILEKALSHKKERPPKREAEKVLYHKYMPYIKLSGVIPDYIVSEYLADLEALKKV